jgi:hypothetical protein
VTLQLQSPPYKHNKTSDIKAGGTVYFDNNSDGPWEVLETASKACLPYWCESEQKP